MALSNGMLLKERYRVDCVLGQGGMGAVYQATDTLFGISVAVKENLFLSDEYTRQFEQEAKILASLRHRSLPRVIDFYRIPGQGQYLIMDYIDGEDLRDLIKRWGRLSEKDVVLVGYHICEALQYLHTMTPPIIHRDIKPGNIKITKSQEVFLVDFGLAKLAETPQQMTITGARAMTPGYSPPEQYGTARTDPRSDIYSLGATLYNALTGAVPEDALDRVTNVSSLTPINQYRDDTEPNLVKVIEKAIAIDPDERYQTASEFQQALLNSVQMESLSLDARMLSHFDSVKPVPAVTPEWPLYADSKQKDRLKKRTKVPSRQHRKGSIQLWQFLVFSIIILFLIPGLIFINPQIANAIRSFSQFGFNAPTLTQSVSVTEMLSTATVMPQTADVTFTPTLLVQETLPAATPIATIQATDEVILTPSATIITPKVITPTIEPDMTPEEPAVVTLADDHPIVFASNRNGSMQLWIMRDDGSDPVQITDMPNGACQPDWAPDGTRIVFISPCRNIQDIYSDSLLYVYDFSEKNVLPLIDLPDDAEVGNFEPSWSPDGTAIAYTSVSSGITHIFIYYLQTEEIREISNSTQDDRQPSWHPDGQSLLFSRKRINWVIWQISTDGNNLNQVSVSGNVSNNGAVWAPDGKYILYSQSDSGKVPWLVKLFEGNFGSSIENRINVTGEDLYIPVLNPRFSGDGTNIVFESWPDGTNHDIYLMDLDGTNLIRLTTSPYYDIDPDWK